MALCVALLPSMPYPDEWFVCQLPIVYSSNENELPLHCSVPLLRPSCCRVAALVGALVAYASRGISLHRQLQVGVVIAAVVGLKRLLADM